MYARCHLCVTLSLFLSMSLGAADIESKPLLEGDDPNQFEFVGIGPEAIHIAAGEISVTGRPHGYFATKQSYHNYILAFEWRYDRPKDLVSEAAFHGNSGLLLHLEKPHKVWPKSIEAQLFHPDAGHLIAIQGAKFQGQKDAAAQKRALKPVGEWNQQTVVCRDGAITCEINGIEVSRGTDASPDRGFIGWQSEGAPVRFRNLKIRKFD